MNRVNLLFFERLVVLKILAFYLQVDRSGELAYQQIQLDFSSFSCRVLVRFLFLRGDFLNIVA